MNEKSVALECFKQFKAGVEKENGATIGTSRTDRGGEFTSQEFDKICVDNGIKRQLTASYTPRQNGVANQRERIDPLWTW